MLLAGFITMVAPRMGHAYESAFADSGFEFGTGGWSVSTAPGTEAEFAADGVDAAEGSRSALVTVGEVREWGVQFGQPLEPYPRGTTCTFAVMARAVGDPVPVSLQIERSADPWDRAARSEQVVLGTDAWQELHVTFTVADDYPEGWFAYVQCTEPDSRFRVDAFRLYEGDYVPLADALAAGPAPPIVRVFDTGATHAEPARGVEVERRLGWQEVTREGVAAGDLALVNDRVAAIARSRAGCVDVYSLGPGRPELRATLSAVGPAPVAKTDYITVAESSPAASSIGIALTFEDGTRGDVSVGLRMGQGIVEVAAGPGVRALDLNAPSRFAILPDFFADDIVLDAPDIPVAEAELPAENFLLLPAPDKAALVMAVWEEAADIPVTIAGDAAARAVQSARLPLADGARAWVALLTGRDVWHVHNVEAADAGEVLALAWHTPFPAQWRVDWRKDDGLTESWEMAVEKSGGGYTKPGWFGWPTQLERDRRRWTTVLGWFAYPCWVDRDGSAYLQPLDKVLTFDGPALIYPINRINSTPLDEYTVVDVVRGTLGVGPCEYILDVEGQASQYRGRATCGTRDLLNPIYQAGRQKQERAVIEQALIDVVVFIRHIRGRIEQYREFGRELIAFLEEQRAEHPELGGQIDELAVLTGQIEERTADRREAIKTPEYAQALADEFRATVLDYDGEDAFERCRRFTAAWVEIGGNQDELVGECRWVVKMVRQKALLLAAVDPRMNDIAREISRRSQIVLRNPASHEAARH
jgi:hypothetical protein